MPAATLLHPDDPRLRQVAARVEKVDSTQIAALSGVLAAFRAKTGLGRAIAGPQIGLMRRVIAFDLGGGPFAIFNPEITWRSVEQQELWDDCLSLPDTLVRVRRFRSVSLHFQDEQLQTQTWERLPPDLAELVQHEIDHLDGVLMTARAAGPDAVRSLDEGRALLLAQRAGRAE